MMKRKLIAPMVALLLCVGMVSVGFAAWVITNEATEPINSGDFTVYPVENNSITIGVEFTDNTITFGSATKTVSGNWLTLNDGAAEDLSASVVITINEWATLKTKTINLQLKDFAVTNAGDFTAAGHIVLPADQNITVTQNAQQNGWDVKVGGSVLAGASVDGATGKVTLPINFGWDLPDGKNPINHFNAMDNTPENRQAANDFLVEIYKLQNAKYEFTIVASVG